MLFFKVQIDLLFQQINSVFAIQTKRTKIYFKIKSSKRKNTEIKVKNNLRLETNNFI